LQEPQPLAELSTDHRNIPQWFTVRDHCRRGASAQGRVLTSHRPRIVHGALPVSRSPTGGSSDSPRRLPPFRQRAADAPQTVIRLTDQPQGPGAARRGCYFALLLGSSAGFT
jgi:hypothetical protein